MPKVLDYQKLAQRKQLEMRIETLNRAREKVLGQLADLGLQATTDTVVAGGRVDVETLEQDKKLIQNLQERTYQDLLTQQARDLIEQAREGSRFVALERRLQTHPEALESVNLAGLQEEQIIYQQKQLEIFDYLSKHFAQFESLQTTDLPEAGRKFFVQVVQTTVEHTGELVAKGQQLERQISDKSKRLDKLRRREQRELEMIHAEAGRSLDEDEAGGQALLNKNRSYQDLLGEIRATSVLRTSLLNQVNNLIDQGIDQLHQIDVLLRSIVGQNQTTRELLYQLKTQNQIWETAALQKYIAEMMTDFDRQIAQVLVEEIGKRFDPGQMDDSVHRYFRQLVEEVIQFQEYLGQIMGDSAQVIEGNLDDLEGARAKYGRLVLDFSASEPV